MRNNGFRIVGLLLLGGVVWLGQPARALAEQLETDNELLQQGLALYEELEYEQAIEVLSAALLESGNDRGEEIAIYRTLGIIYVLLGRETQAGLALTRLLCVDPSFDFDDFTSPRIRSVFDRVRGEWDGEGRPCPEAAGGGSDTPPATEVLMDHDLPGQATAAEPLDLEVTVTDPELRVHSVILHYRQAGEGSFNQLNAAMQGPGVFAATIPGDAVSPPSVEYYFRAVDDAGGTLAARGTGRAPMRVPVAEVETGGGSVLRSWWLWTIIGVAVVGVAVGVTLGVLYGPGPGPDPDEQGVLTVRICDPEQGLCP